jgi:hypothetical protein
MEHGKVTSVYYRDGVVLCDVRSLRISTPYDKLPVLKSHSGFVEMPSQGDKVLMDTLADGKRFITHVMATEPGVPESMSEGELSFQVDQDTKLLFKEQTDGSYNLTISSSGDLNIEASGQIQMEAGGGVYINGTKFQDHDHDYSWDSDGGSGTTDSPN